MALASVFAVAWAQAATVYVSKSYPQNAARGGDVFETPYMGFARYIADSYSTDLNVTDEIIIEDSSLYHADEPDGNFHMGNGPVYLHAVEGQRPVLQASADATADSTYGNCCVINFSYPTGTVVEGITFVSHQVFNPDAYNNAMLIFGNWSSSFEAPIVRDCIFISTEGMNCITYASGGIAGIDAVEIDHCAFYISYDVDKSAMPLRYNGTGTDVWDADHCSFVMSNGVYVGVDFPFLNITNSIVTNAQEWGAFTSPQNNLIDRCFISNIGSWSGVFPNPDTNIPAEHNGNVFADPKWAGDPSTGDFLMQADSPCVFNGANNIGYDIWTGASSLVEVPDVSAMSESAAVTALEEAGFIVTVQYESNDSIPAGSAVRTEPGAGEELDSGSAVTLVVSTGASGSNLPLSTLLGLTLLGGAICLGGIACAYRRG